MPTTMPTTSGWSPEATLYVIGGIITLVSVTLIPAVIKLMAEVRAMRLEQAKMQAEADARTNARNAQLEGVERRIIQVAQAQIPPEEPK